MDYGQITEIIANVGFPIGVACYCLWVLNTSIKENTQIMTKLYEKMGGDE